MAERKKRIGRPTKPGTAGQRNSLGLRVTAETKRKLEAAAVKSGRSQSQEAEFRIEQSFLEERAHGGRELHGLLMLMVGAAEIIQARTGKSWSSDWATSVALRETWRKLAVAAGPRLPAEQAQHFIKLLKRPDRPNRPTYPALPGVGVATLQMFDNPDLGVDVKTYAAEMAAFEKAMKKWDRDIAKWDRQDQALRQESQEMRDAYDSALDLGKDAAAELFPRREAVMQTAIPAQRVEKKKEK